MEIHQAKKRGSREKKSRKTQVSLAEFLFLDFMFYYQNLNPRPRTPGALTSLPVTRPNESMEATLLTLRVSWTVRCKSAT
jgi:hypothetical protein